MPSNTPQIALDIINKEKEERTGILNLNNCGLTEWPEELFEMEWLEVINVGNFCKWNPVLKNLLTIPNILYNNKVTNSISKYPDLSPFINLKALSITNAFF